MSGHKLLLGETDGIRVEGDRDSVRRQAVGLERGEYSGAERVGLESRFG
ncbi:hypothetical protein [Streptomyces sp. NPDC002276]